MTEREEMVREQIAKEFYLSGEVREHMPWSQAREVRTAMADLAYTKADQILNLTDPKGNKLLGIIEEWKDEPDSEGWWWFTDKGHPAEPWLVCDLAAAFLGKWSKAIVPEIEKGK